MIYATDPTPYDDMRENIVRYYEDEDQLRLDATCNPLARAVIETYRDLLDVMASIRKDGTTEITNFNAACERYRAAVTNGAQ